MGMGKPDMMNLLNGGLRPQTSAESDIGAAVVLREMREFLTRIVCAFLVIHKTPGGIESGRLSGFWMCFFYNGVYSKSTFI
jgi:hypothetical protein